MRGINNGDDAVSNKSILYINGVQKQPPVNWRWRYIIKNGWQQQCYYWLTFTFEALSHLRYFDHLLFHCFIPPPPPLCSLLCCNNLPYFSTIGWGTIINTSVVKTYPTCPVTAQEFSPQMFDSKSSSPETARIIFVSTTLVLIMVPQPMVEK